MLLSLVRTQGSDLQDAWQDGLRHHPPPLVIHHHSVDDAHVADVEVGDHLQPVEVLLGQGVRRLSDAGWAVAISLSA